jgi:hypothetical protein
MSASKALPALELAVVCQQSIVGLWLVGWGV